MGLTVSGSTSNYRTDELTDIINYFKGGHHAFVGCDDPDERDKFVEALQVELDGEIQECIVGSGVSNREEFVAKIVIACLNLVAALGVPFLERRPNIANSLAEVMDLYSERARQGFLILSELDRVIEMQQTIEFEGPLRSVMQLQSDVAVVIIASHDTINGLVGDYARPFYMSFRVFRL